MTKNEIEKAIVELRRLRNAFYDAEKVMNNYAREILSKLDANRINENYPMGVAENLLGKALVNSLLEDV